MSQLSPGDEKPKSFEELMRRLEEAEETIRAIREGEIDALVVRQVHEEQVFTLHGGKDSYRAFMETMGHGAAALDASGNVLYANSIMCALIGTPVSLLQGTTLWRHLSEPAASQVAGLIADAEASGSAASSAEIAFNLNGEARHYLASVEPLDLGVVKGWAVTFTDLTDRVRAEESLASERAARAIISSANEAVVVCDVEGRITHVNTAVAAISPGEVLGKHFHEAIALTVSDTIGLMQSEDIVRLTISGTSVQGIEASAPHAPRVKDLLISAAPLSTGDDAPRGCVITMVDLSQRKAAEKQQNLLMAELDHRVKNTLTLVLSILDRTSEKDIDVFKRTFAGRIHALAATHNLLARNSWSTLSIEDVFTAETAPYVKASSDRLELRGARLSVKSRAAIAIGLIFHELVSNAVKYGALSNSSGKVMLTINHDEPGKPSLEWLERGGPTVSEPKRKGFGRTVIARSLSYSEEGGAEIAFEPEGVRCTIRIPAEDVVSGSAN